MTTAVKVRLAHRMFVNHYRYSNDPAHDDQVHGDSREIIAAKILNNERGICNLASSTAFVILLRAIGVPARVCGGYWKQSEEHGGSHLWTQYWNNVRWVNFEPQVGMGSDDPVEKRRAATDEEIARELTLYAKGEAV